MSRTDTSGTGRSLHLVLNIHTVSIRVLADCACSLGAIRSSRAALLTRTIWKRQVALVALVLRRSVKR